VPLADGGAVKKKEGRTIVLSHSSRREGKERGGRKTRLGRKRKREAGKKKG